ncbi:hypothetical protein IL306_005561 [Fusarium sp. DS 682]|nr:hypothetical protein IL306_005561 [Fusarium sp. DS 682]
MVEIREGVYQVDRSFFDKFFQNLSCDSQRYKYVRFYGTTHPAEGTIERFLIPSANEDWEPWSATQALGLEVSANSNYGAGFCRLYKNAEEVFRYQPTRLFLHGYLTVGNQMELWFFSRSGVYRSGVFSDQLNHDNIINNYAKISDAQLGINPIVHIDDKRSPYIFVKGDATIRPYESDHQRRYKLTLDELPAFIPDRLFVSNSPVCFRATDCHGNEFVVKFSCRKEESRDEEKFLRLTKARKVWGVIELIDYQCLDTDIVNLSCMVMSPFGRPLDKYRTVTEVLECLRDTIKAHRSLLVHGKLLHQDISSNNLIISNTGTDDRQAPRGVLIDFDNAMDLEVEPEDPHGLTGTKAFMAIDVSRPYDDRVIHTHRHDLESFFYVFLFLAVGGHGEVPDESRLRPWEIGRANWPEIGKRKIEDISNKVKFDAIVAEFKPEFEQCKDLAYTLRRILFYPDGEEFFIGTKTDKKAVDKLYGNMIRAFEKAVASEKGINTYAGRLKKALMLA